MRSSSLSDESGTHKRTPAFQKIMFAVKLLLGALPLVGFYCYARFLADMYMDGEWATYKQVKAYVNGTEHHNDFLIMGDSVAQLNLNASTLSSSDCSVFNIALRGSTPIENYYTLKTYLDHDNTVGTILLVFTPSHYYSADYITARTEYFHVLSMRDMFDIYRNALSYKDTKGIWNFLVSTDPPILKLIQTAAFYPPKYLPAMNNAHFVRRHDINTKSAAMLEENNGSYIVTHDRANAMESYANQKSFLPHPMMTLYMRRLLELCREHNIRVVIEQSPRPEIAKKNTLQSFESDYLSYLRSFVSDFVEPPSQTALMYYDNNYFYDGAHMNKSGTVAYTQYIKQTYIAPYIHNKTTAEVIK